ncbi:MULTISPECIES: sulfurtransferase [unclassified Micromonospora]|uniref:sulfurtransferase n=1 Tax=unclassified Micromonospora TaxID=2617518 RepID=UPI001C5EE762|nr:sulfurtransferase [Micromonospora sp. RL09-050-HVF-A]MBW4705562.1 sulfurtransferase [Micromonospora sp. RL09-050-HVF-A]
MSGTATPLIEPDRLATELARPDPPTLLDVRWRLVGPPGRDDYTAGHLPGAVFVDLDTVLCGPPGPAGRHPLPEPAALQAALRAAGVRAGHPVVVYDDGDGLAAARAWWTLRWAGHRSVRVLSGGWPGWLAAGLPGTVEVPTPQPGDVTVTPGGLPVLDADDAARLGAADDGVLLDVRAAPRYRGETEPIDPVAGHVPGAVNLPAPEYVTEGRYLTAEALRDRFAAAGVRADQPVGAYCGSGVTAAQTVLALHLAGRPDAALYVGSWSGWVADPSRPVATGPTPAG